MASNVVTHFRTYVAASGGMLIFFERYKRSEFLGLMPQIFTVYYSKIVFLFGSL